MKYYHSGLLTAALGAYLFLTTGCHSISPANVPDPKRLVGKKQIYVVQSALKERGFRKEIERNLTARGLTVTFGPKDGLKPEAELFLVYEDRWTWDMVMYPRQVNMAIYDAKTQELLGSVEFKNNAFHTFPDPPEITDELLGRIFGEPEGRYMK